MADQLQLRGGTTTEHSTFTGALKEITVDTTKKTIVVHDNSTVGGIPLAKENLSNVPAGTITSTMIADGTIATADIADSAVTSAKIADGTIVNADINANAAIDLSKLANGALPSGITVGSSNITNLSIATADIADGAVTSAKIADGTIVNADVSATASIALSKLATGSLPAAITVNSSNIEDLSIATGDLADGAVTSAKIADGTIINGDINSNAAIDLGKLAVGALPTGITIASANIVDGTIVNADINTAAAIAGTKISPDFGSQNVTTTGTSTSASFIPSSSTVPSNGVYLPAANSVGISTNSTERLRITSTGVGIGTTSPGTTLDVNGGAQVTGSVSGYNGGEIRLGATTADLNHAVSTQSTGTPTMLFDHRGTGNTGQFAWRVGTGGASERMRIDSSGRLGLGTSSPSQLLHLNQSTGDTMIQMYSNTGFVSRLQVTGSDVFAINTGFTERMRILSNGDITFGNGITNAATALSNTVGIGFEVSNGAGFFSRNGAASGFFNRKGSDGDVISIIQDGVQEGTIHVSGTTVTLVGAHLSRWSQILGIDPYDKTVRPEILRGTVMSNLEEMCDWIAPDSGDAQANEQLNKTKISDVEGDKNVAGVFQSWDDDDDTWVNDYYLAMTGDFVIRIAAGVTVERGDLLMSAGDGTAKPQTDDALRSCTIAKVTSTHVSHTFDDGSYCVPCVLMAC